ncbi:MAG: glycosyltransferase family 2 protein [Verrucomicrobiota bacterium]|nr:glycosyltransferase family 2 protein [Verrucomicrobiota bacterium]
MREPISACIITYNEEYKIGRCLRSVTWCDEIVILDSFSTDRTFEICRRYTDRIRQNVWLGYVGQRNLARDMAQHPWILFLDADEEVSPALRDEILAEFERGTGDCVGYEFPRLVYYLGRWIRHGEWHPDIKLRLFRKTDGHSEGEEPHDRIAVRGPVKRLKNPIWHYTYDDIRDQLATLNRFSGITAQQRFVQRRPFHWLDLLLRPPFRFLRSYFLRGGILDGAHGFIIAVLSAYGAFVKYAKIWEIEHQRFAESRTAPNEPPDRPVQEGRSR